MFWAFAVVALEDGREVIPFNALKRRFLFHCIKITSLFNALNRRFLLYCILTELCTLYLKLLCHSTSITFTAKKSQPIVLYFRYNFTTATAVNGPFQAHASAISEHLTEEEFCVPILTSELQHQNDSHFDVPAHVVWRSPSLRT